MKFISKKYTTKHGDNIIIREAEELDAEVLIENAKNSIKNLDDILLENFNPTIDQELEWINSFRNKENNLLLVATYEDKVIGNIEIRTPSNSKNKHTALIGMGVIKAWRGKGIGTFLMDSLITWVKEKSSIEILWLQVFATNENAIKLYQKMGFTIDGIQKDFIKLDENKYTDIINMSKKI